MIKETVFVTKEDKRSSGVNTRGLEVLLFPRSRLQWK